MRIGYARVATADQALALQTEALETAGCARIFTDQGVTGIATRRPGLDQALAALGPGDVLVVWKLDRLGRSLSHLVQLMAGFAERGIGFESLTEKIDTSTATGRLVYQIAAVFSEFERSLIAERTRAGMDAARRKGTRMGRKRVLTPSQIAHARSLVDGGESIPKVAQSLNVSRASLYRALQQQQGAA